MRTRDQIYSQDAASILRDVTMYRALQEQQLLKLYPGKQAQVKNLLSYLVRQGRLFLHDSGLYTAEREPAEVDHGLLAALWVLVDLIDQVDYHSTCDYPGKIIFFSNDEVYEIVYVAYGQETLISHVLEEDMESPPNYIVLVDKPEQIYGITIPNISGFCTVSPDGAVEYFKTE